ncbi:fatty-acyl-CoA synthase/long-chain acyl-CoA synthetase [Arcanobacterium pluranimalium]|uniref:class I adenylate-forming enzyme family protein n=1 Tax=Arcanobacterium pluranimalium TaxID=108028 RepID=UPI00195E6D6B|nr:class I adenylate-forming enzyme family protein [Arcanobacterium pluranimalium]MBM7825543.1 fatty-acyl-CoA synthase/long-chain acyl-CoA synthetase [Arcanobacterium pluranimalium]
MLIGEELWDDAVVEGLVNFHVYGREVRSYCNAASSLYETLCDTAQRLPDKVAIYTEDGKTFTFAQVKKYVDDFAFYLSHEQAIGHHDRVGVLLDNGIDFITTFYALNRLGAIIVPLPGKFRRAEIMALVERADLKIVVCQDEQAPWFTDTPTVVTSSQTCAFGLPLAATEDEEIARARAEFCTQKPQLSVEDDAILLYTSGTTSQSKGVLLTNMNAVHAVCSYQRVLDLHEDDSTIIAVPIYHVTGMIAIIALFIYLGGSIHVQKRMSGRPFVREIFASNITFIHASPTVFALMLEEQERFPQLPSVQKIGCGAAHMPISRIQALHAWMPQMEFRTIYGLTESCSPGFVFPDDAATSPHLGSSGKPIPGLDVKICNENGQELGFDEIGEIVIRGANIARRYDKIASESFSPDGWLATGDVGRMTSDGYVYVLDRKKDLINRGGEKIWCIDIEEELRLLPQIADAALVGVPDSIYGEVPAAAVVLAEGAVFDEEAIRQTLNKRVARYRVPVYFAVVDALPLTAGSKIDKKAIRELFTGSDTEAS